VSVLKSFAGGRLFGATWGSGPASVLALHGWRRSHSDFDPVFAAAGTKVAAVGLDLFGFGATPPPPEAWGSPEYARVVASVFEEAALGERVTVVGHSFGGRVALFLEQLVPDRIERLVLTGVPLLDRVDRRSRVAVPYRLGRRLHRWGLVTDERMETLRQRHGSPDYRAATGVMREVFVRVLGEDYREVIAGTRCPVDLVWGAEDTESPLEVAQRAAGLFPSASLTVLDGVGHLTPTEAPDALARSIVEGTAAASGTDGASPTEAGTPTATGAPASPATGGRRSGGPR
jgi:pimeloyl-ACP methyl ester carboxylesterase